MADPDHLTILSTLEQLPFPVGKTLLVDVLTGEPNETVRRCRLDREKCFGCLSGHGPDEVERVLERLQANGLVERASLQGKSYLKVLRVTSKGKDELKHPTLHERKVQASFTASEMTDHERRLCDAFGFFLKKHTEEQQHAIVAQSSRVLCVAGAGSGKTTVLTKRIEFLTRFQGVPPERILAITFTRKARQEMQRRLHGLVQVETFNSFCEGILSTHGDLLYGRQVRMIDYKDRARATLHAIKRVGLDMDKVLRTYFTPRQMSEKPKDALMRSFMHDLFGILDYHANNAQPLAEFGTTWEAQMVYRICVALREELQKMGLRDYSDQLIDALALFEKHPDLIPRYDHILVDEYQDVNTVQQRLLEVLAPRNLFVVGDPRQSIFGWRGSRVKYILDFPGPGTTTVILTRNYRSAPGIVELANHAIAPMRLPDLHAFHEEPARMRARVFTKDEDEHAFIVEMILASRVPREEIFVLARTNRQLEALSQVLQARGIAHILRADDNRPVEPRQGDVTLSTVHAIKGLEADVVFLMGANAQSFPCIASDHPVLELVKREEHDREEEELRLFYVAITRARRELYVSCTGTPTRFMSRDVKRLLGLPYDGSLTHTYKPQGGTGSLFDRLREWRTAMSRKSGVPAYMILPDRTLMALAEQRPGTVAELNEVPGIGPVKVERYGEELLSILR